MSMPDRPDRPDLHWDGSRWLRWDGAQWSPVPDQPVPDQPVPGQGPSSGGPSAAGPSRRALVIVLVVALVLLAGAGAALWWSVSGGDEVVAPSAGGLPTSAGTDIVTVPILTAEDPFTPAVGTDLKITPDHAAHPDPDPGRSTGAVRRHEERVLLRPREARRLPGPQPGEGTGMGGSPRPARHGHRVLPGDADAAGAAQ